MYSHLVLGANDIAASKAFYDATLGALGYGPGMADAKGRVFWFTDKGIFAISTPINGEPATAANGGTVGFAAESTEQCDAWHAAGLAHGGTAIEDPPGVREMGATKMYLAYMRDPTGNKLCVMKRL